jgi:replication factor A1
VFVSLSDFGGRSLGTINSTQLKIDPDFPDAERLKQWYITEGKAAACISLSHGTSNIGQNVVRKTIAQIRDENLGQSYTPDWITIKAEISYVRSENFYYPACPLMLDGKPCNKKVIQDGDGMWQCERCNKVIRSLKTVGIGTWLHSKSKITLALPMLLHSKMLARKYLAALLKNFSQ